LKNQALRKAIHNVSKEGVMMIKTASLFSQLLEQIPRMEFANIVKHLHRRRLLRDDIQPLNDQMDEVSDEIEHR
jgi:hypothetical protein